MDRHYFPSPAPPGLASPRSPTAVFALDAPRGFPRLAKGSGRAAPLLRLAPRPAPRVAGAGRVSSSASEDEAEELVALGDGRAAPFAATFRPPRMR